MKPTLDSLLSLTDSRYPQLLSDPSVLSVVRKQVLERTQGALMVADLGCGQEPVSRNIFRDFPKNAKIMGVDSDYSSITGNEVREFENGVTFYPRDIRDARQLRGAKKDFFQKYRSFGKNKFDVIVLSNLLNYITEDGEVLDEGSISKKLEEMVERFIVRNLTKKGILIIQNGDKHQRDVRFEKEHINEYFSPQLEELLGKYLEDFFYMGIAAMDIEQSYWKSFLSRYRLQKPLSPIESFTSLDELQELRKNPRLVTAVNVRCMQLIK